MVLKLFECEDQTLVSSNYAPTVRALDHGYPILERVCVCLYSGGPLATAFVAIKQNIRKLRRPEIYSKLQGNITMNAPNAKI